MGGGKEDLARFAAGQLLAERRELETLALRQRAVEQAKVRMGEKLEEQERELDALKTRVDTGSPAASATPTNAASVPCPWRTKKWSSS